MPGSELAKPKAEPLPWSLTIHGVIEICPKEASYTSTVCIAWEPVGVGGSQDSPPPLPMVASTMAYRTDPSALAEFLSCSKSLAQTG